jgi:hypothetical protein
MQKVSVVNNYNSYSRILRVALKHIVFLIVNFVHRKFLLIHICLYTFAGQPWSMHNLCFSHPIFKKHEINNLGYLFKN